MLAGLALCVKGGWQVPNSSASGGYLLQTAGPIDSNALIRFLHDVIVGISGLTNTLVRPAFQQDVPVIPGIDVDWCSFWISSRNTPNMAWYRQDESNGTSYNNEDFDLSTTFYGPQSLGFATAFRDGFQIQQNLDVLTSAGIGVNGTGELTFVPELVNDRYYQRCDIIVNMNRQVGRDYDIYHLVAVQGIITALTSAGPITENFKVPTN